jgi:hypothetical protein
VSEEKGGSRKGGEVSIKGLQNSIALSQISHGQNYTNSRNTNLGSQGYLYHEEK